MKINVHFKNKLKLEASFDQHAVKSDIPIPEGDGTAPNPYEFFITSVALCSAHYIRSFCLARKLPLEGIEITQEFNRDADYKSKFDLKIKLPSNFPEKYRGALVSAAQGCTVKKTIEAGPIFNIAVE
jgi:ribosomal protein S12 methylthiotransferase accessory factor